MSTHDTLSVADAAKILGVSASAIYQLCSARRLAHYRVGLGRGTIRIERAALSRYLAACRVPEAAPVATTAEARRPAKRQAAASGGVPIPGFPSPEEWGVRS